MGMTVQFAARGRLADAPVARSRWLEYILLVSASKINRLFYGENFTLRARPSERAWSSSTVTLFVL